MSDFPKGGDVLAIQQWLNEKGFRTTPIISALDADSLLGQDKDDLIHELGRVQGLRLWGLLNTARATQSAAAQVGK